MGDSSIIGCASRRKSKGKGPSSDAIVKKENGDGSKDTNTAVHNTRGGLRVYKIVMLGDGGVGKSGITLQ